MKAILLSIRPNWVKLILNKKKIYEIRRQFPKDFVGWVYIYCTKNGEYLTRGNKGNVYPSCCISNGIQEWHLNGKVVARFWCDKVDEMIVGEDCCGDAEIEEGYSLIEQTCLTEIEIIKYLGGIYKSGYAIHISKLETFDKPKELGEFYTTRLDKTIQELFDNSIQLPNGVWVKPLTKAPQNFMFIDIE